MNRVNTYLLVMRRVAATAIVTAVVAVWLYSVYYGVPTNPVFYTVAVVVTLAAAVVATPRASTRARSPSTATRASSCSAGSSHTSTVSSEPQFWQGSGWLIRLPPAARRRAAGMP